MKTLALIFALISAVLVPALSYAVDSSSTEYQSGKIVGYIIGGVVLFLIARKLLGK